MSLRCRGSGTDLEARRERKKLRRVLAASYEPNEVLKPEMLAKAFAAANQKAIFSRTPCSVYMVNGYEN